MSFLEPVEYLIQRKSFKFVSALAACALSCFAAVVVCISFPIGGVALAQVKGDDYREATCTVGGAGWDSEGRCEVSVTSTLTGEKTFTVRGVGDLKQCCDESRGGCSDECLVYFDEKGEGEAVHFRDPRFWSLGLGLAFTGAGAAAILTCCLCCVFSCFFFMSDKRDAVSGSVHAQVVGAASGQGSASVGRPVVDITKLRRGLDQFGRAMYAVIGVVALVSIVVGCYIFGVLSYLSGLEKVLGPVTPPPLACLAGLVLALTGLLAAVIANCFVMRMKAKFRAEVEEMALDATSTEDVQRKFAAKLVKQLNDPNSKAGKKCKKWLLEAGVGDDKLTAIITAPTERVFETVLEQLGNSVMARITCKLIKEFNDSELSQVYIIIVGCLIVAPSLLSTLLLWLSAFCVNFQLSFLTGIPGICITASYVFMHLQYHGLVVVSCSIQQFAMFMVVIGYWAGSGTSALSVILLVLAIPLIIGFCISSLTFLCLLKPFTVALEELALEFMYRQVWAMYGCERDKEIMVNCIAKVRGTFIGARLLPHDLEDDTCSL